MDVTARVLLPVAVLIVVNKVLLPCWVVVFAQTYSQDRTLSELADKQHYLSTVNNG